MKDTFAKAEKNNKKAEHRNVRKKKRKSILKNGFLFLNILFQQCDFVFIFIQAYEKHLFNETALHNLNDSNLFNEDSFQDFSFTRFRLPANYSIRTSRPEESQPDRKTEKVKREQRHWNTEKENVQAISKIFYNFQDPNFNGEMK